MKQFGNQDYVFKGWDWPEVAEYFSFRNDLTEEECESIIDKAIEDVRNDIRGEDETSRHPDIKKLKEFVRMITLDSYGFARPLWQGLYRIEHDDVFMQYFKMLYKHLWT